MPTITTDDDCGLTVDFRETPSHACQTPFSTPILIMIALLAQVSQAHYNSDKNKKIEGAQRKEGTGRKTFRSTMHAHTPQVCGEATRSKIENPRVRWQSYSPADRSNLPTNRATTRQAKRLMIPKDHGNSDHFPAFAIIMT